MKSARQLVIDEILMSRGLTQRELTDDESTLIAIPNSCGVVPYINIRSPFDSQPAKMWQVKKLKELGYSVYDLRVDTPPIISGEVQQLLSSMKEEKVKLDNRDSDLLKELSENIIGSDVSVLTEDGDLNTQIFTPLNTQDEPIDVYGIQTKKLDDLSALYDELNFSIRDKIKEDIYNKDKSLNDARDATITSNIYKAQHLFDNNGITLDDNQKHIMSIGLDVRRISNEQIEELNELMMLQHKKDIENTNNNGKAKSNNFIRPVRLDGMSDRYRKQMNTVLNRPAEDILLEEPRTNQPAPNKLNNILGGLRGRR